MSSYTNVTCGVRVDVYAMLLLSPYAAYTSQSDKYDAKLVDEEIAVLAYNYLKETQQNMKLYIRDTTIFGFWKNTVSLLSPIEEDTEKK